MALYQKYRSKTFSELVGEDHVSKTLIEGVKRDKLTHAYLLTGPRGTGKTSTARLLAKAINCKKIIESRKKGEEVSGEPCNECDSCREIAKGNAVDIIEIDAASHTKVDEIREIIENAKFLPTNAAKKVYIIDEVHMLSNSSFNALLKTLEEPPGHVVFILATTEEQKLPATILSRTQRYDFHRVAKEDIAKNLRSIANAEKIDIDDDSLEIIAVNAEGSHRDAIGLLEQVASVSDEKIDAVQVKNILGIAESKEVFELTGAIFNNNPEEGLKIAHKLFQEGVNLITFNKEIVEVLRKIMLLKMSGKFLFEDTKESKEIIEEMSKRVEVVSLIKIIEIFLKSEQLFKNISSPVLPIEMAIVESCAVAQDSPQIQNSKFKIQNDSSHSVAGSLNGHSEAMPKNFAAGRSFVDTRDEKNKRDQEDDGRKGNDDKKIESVELPRDSHAPLDSVPVKVYEMTDDLWQKVVEITKKENNSLAALLRDAKPIEMKNDKMILGVKFPFHKDKISENKNRSYLEAIFSELMGKKCSINCEISDLRIKPKEKLKDDDLLAAAEEVFEVE